MGFARIVFRRIVPVLVLIAAIFVGWLSTTPMAFGVLFATVLPILEGRLPPVIFGHGKMVGTPPVPDDMTPEPRPDNEVFQVLPGGYKMPLSGIGMCCRYSAYDDVLVRRSVLWYLLLGGRHIDGAHLYLNHRAIGLGIKDAVNRGVPREEIFFTTKLFPTLYGYNTTLETVPTFLEETGLEYIDLVLMHAPNIALARTECTRAGLSDKECRQETWKALSELRDRGIMRNIGVSNFRVDQMMEIEELDLAPIACNQFQWNAFVPAKQQKIFDYCVENNIAVTGYQSLGGSLQRAQASTVDTLQELASKYDVSVSKLMLRWSMQKGTAVIPGTGNPKHMKENLEVYSLEISTEDMEAIDGLRSSEIASKFVYADPDMFS
jgi:diketogulonate reductase-like aldo/keto reductase